MVKDMSNEQTLDMLNDWANGTITKISDKCLSNAIIAVEKLVKIEKVLTLMHEKGNSEEYHNEGYKTMLLELKTLGDIQQIVNSTN